MNFIDKKFAAKILRDVQYGVGRIHHTTQGRDRALCLDIYMPEASAADDRSSLPDARPALILAFGGAYHRGSKEKDEFDIDGNRNTPVSDYCFEFARRGYVTFSIDYRLVQEDPDPGTNNVILDKDTISRSRMDHVRNILGLKPATTYMLWAGIEAAVDDMRKAFDFVSSHASTYGVDRSRIAVGGFSAGARMAASAVFGKGIPAAAIVAISGMIGIAEAERLIKPDDKYPPVMMVMGENDLDFMKVLCLRSHAHFDRVGVTNQLWEAPGATHFYPATSMIHSVDNPTITGRLEDVMCDFLWRSLQLHHGANQQGDPRK